MAVEDLTMQAPAVEAAKKTRATAGKTGPASPTLVTLLAIPFASAIAFGVHSWCGDKEPIPEPRYFGFLGAVFVGGLLLAGVQRVSARVRQWVTEMCPIIAGGILFLTLWEIVTAGFRLFPLPYFPGPASVFKGLIEDWAMLGNSAMHSLWLLVR